MKKKTKELTNMILRYFLIILVAIPHLWLFYYILTPLTIYPIYFILNLFIQGVSLGGNIISLEGYSIEIIPACVAGAAYYLLFLLNLSTPKINLKKRLQIIAFSFATLLVINIFRIILLIFLLDSLWFDITHKVFWHLLSTIFVVGIWGFAVNIFKIKNIPFYSDLKNLYRKSLLKRK